MTAIEESRQAALVSEVRRWVRPLPGVEPAEHPAQDVPDHPHPVLPFAALPEPPGPAGPAGCTLEHAAACTGAGVMLRLMLEVLDGRRPAAHLAAAVTGPVLRYLVAARATPPRERLRRLPDRAGPGARLRTMRLSQPCDGVAEVGAVCQLRGKVRALAARFELDEHSPLGWRCTAVRQG